MVDEKLRVIMRIRALALTAIVILSSITSVIASNTVTTQDTAISGNYTMTGNYTVSHGTTLTLKTGATIDMQDFWLKVDGNLIADNVTIMSSIQTTGPGSHNAGVWDHLTITSTGSATLDNVTISNAKSCIIVDGTLTAKNLDLQDCLIGMEVDGTATIDGFSASQVDIDGVRVTGDADISDSQHLKIVDKQRRISGTNVYINCYRTGISVSPAYANKLRVGNLYLNRKDYEPFL